MIRVAGKARIVNLSQRHNGIIYDSAKRGQIYQSHTYEALPHYKKEQSKTAKLGDRNRSSPSISVKYCALQVMSCPPFSREAAYSLDAGMGL